MVVEIPCWSICEVDSGVQTDLAIWGSPPVRLALLCLPSTHTQLYLHTRTHTRARVRGAYREHMHCVYSIQNMGDPIEKCP